MTWRDPNRIEDTRHPPDEEYECVSCGEPCMEPDGECKDCEREREDYEVDMHYAGNSYNDEW